MDGLRLKIPVWALALCLNVILLVCKAPPAAAEYILNPGDVIEFRAVGIDELTHSGAIDPDGQAWLPLVGPIKAAGLTLTELRTKVAELLPTKVFRRRTPDGGEYPVVITPDEISVAVTEFRPVYLDGDVAKPGAQTYRPGMTVRQALALAGGYDTTRFTGRDPILESEDFRADYVSLWTEFAKEQVHVARLKAELANSTTIDQRGFIDTPIPKTVTAQIDQLEAAQLAARNADFKDEKDHFHRAIAQEDERIAALSDQEAKEQQGAQADQTDLNDMRDNFKKGVIPVMRLTDMRRLTLFSATQALQTTALLAQAQREREDLDRNLQKVDNDRHMQLLSDLQQAEVNLQSLRARLEAVGDKLMYSGIVRSQLVRGSGESPDVRIFRDSKGNRQTLTADEDTEVMPGDVIEVALRLDQVASQSP